jgi:hypothetical protein
VITEEGPGHSVFRYQVGVIGASQAQLDTLRTTIYKRLIDIGLSVSDLLFLKNREVLRRETRSPFVGVYFGKHSYDADDEALLEDLRLDSVVVIPVVPTLDEFSDQVPPALASVNGLALDGADAAMERICAIVLQQFRLLRKERRIFISYRRADATEVATQLYAALDSRGFDVFLDTNGVPPGEDFQDVLWHRLADSDVVVLLDTEGFSESRWTQEELAKANTTNIQILHLLWPGRPERADSAFSIFRQLIAEEFIDGSYGSDAKLVDGAVNQITIEVESLRARAIAARHRFLVDAFCDAARAVGLEPSVQPNRKIFVAGGRNPVVAIPLVGVPNAEGLHEEVVEFPESALTDETRLWAIFDERGLLPRTLKHLAWLSPKLPIAAVPVFDVVAKLGEELP